MAACCEKGRKVIPCAGLKPQGQCQARSCKGYRIVSLQVVFFFFFFLTQTDKTEWEAVQMDVAYQGRDFTASAMCVNPDFLTGSGVYLLQYLQSFTPNFALGSELLVRRSAAMGQQAILSGAAQLRTDRWHLAATVGTAAVHASYVYKYNKTLQVILVCLVCRFS